MRIHAEYLLSFHPIVLSCRRCRHWGMRRTPGRSPTDADGSIRWLYNSCGQITSPPRLTAWLTDSSPLWCLSKRRFSWPAKLRYMEHMGMKCSTGRYISSLHSKTDGPAGQKSRDRRLRWFFHIMGLLALLWFLVRVIPKPSRATYPCQRVAFPLASGFVVWLIGVAGSVAAFRRARFYFARSRYVIGAVFVAASVATALATMSGGGKNEAKAGEPVANDPVGVARGINPGRVVWVHDPDATDWEGPASGESCWEPDHTDQAAVDRMLSTSIRSLADRASDAGAWGAIFRYFNLEHGNGDRGYQEGEKIAIKINLTTGNASYTSDKGTREKTTHLDKAGDTMPQMILALLRQLVDVVGVEQSDISVGDPVSYFPEPWHDHMARQSRRHHAADDPGSAPATGGRGRRGAVGHFDWRPGELLPAAVV